MPHLDVMSLVDAAIAPTFRSFTCADARTGVMGELTQKRIGWWWRDSAHGATARMARWWFTTTLVVHYHADQAQLSTRRGVRACVRRRG